jgi:hypothetical protein
MAIPENTFIAGVHRYLPVDLYHMKNHNQYNGGIADVWYSGNAADLWVEYKYITVPARSETQVKIELSELQKNWLRNRYAEGRRVAVIIGCKEGGVYLADDSWDCSYTSGEFRKLIRRRNELANIIISLCSK